MLSFQSFIISTRCESLNLAMAQRPVHQICHHETGRLTQEESVIDKGGGRSLFLSYSFITRWQNAPEANWYYEYQTEV